MLVFIYLISLVVLLCFSAFFSASETALFSLEHFQIKDIKNRNPKTGDRLENLLLNPRRLLIGILIGNTLVNVMASIVAASVMVLIFGKSLVVLMWAVFLMTGILLIGGEITPKNYAILNNEKISTFVLSFLEWFINLINPLIGIFIKMTDLLFPEKEFANKEKITPSFSEEEVDTLLKVTEKDGIIGPKEGEMLRNILDFGEMTVESVMTPRTELTAIDANMELLEIVSLVKEAKHRCLPVYSGSIDNVIGKVKAKNLLIRKPQKLEEVIEPILFIPKEKRVDELLVDMRKKRKNIAIVVDEYGGTDGIVTLEDLVEEIVGEIIDEFDEKETLYVKLDNNMYKVRGKMRLDILNDILGTDLPEEEADTLNGFLSSITGEVPVKNQRISYENIDFYVEKASAVQVLEVLVKINKI